MRRARPFLLCGNRNGVALMLVLWVIIVLGAVTAGVAALARSETRLVELVRTRTVARYAAESGVIAATERFRTLMRDAETDEQRANVYRRLQDELAEPEQRRIGKAVYQVTVEDLSSRIDLNAVDETVLLSLFSELFGDRRGEALADALLDWTDPDNEQLPNGAEEPAYLRADSRFRPTNQPLRRLDELTRIVGFDEDVAATLAPFVTVWGDDRVNVNTAPRTVLAAIPEIGNVAADYILAARAEGRIMANTAMVYQEIVERSGGVLAPFLGGVSTIPGNLLVISRGWQPGHPLTHEVQAVIAMDGLLLPQGPTIRVLHWSERDR